jgi:hypothetical protein
MKFSNTFIISVIACFPLFFQGCATSDQTSSNNELLQKLQGNWEYWGESDNGSVTPPDNLAPSIYCHYNIEVKGNTLFINRVWDHDVPNGSGLRGDVWREFKLKADGRRFHGTNIYFADRPEAWGYVNETLTEIQLSFYTGGTYVATGGRAYRTYYLRR